MCDDIVPRRRRGKTLNRALLEAAWEELVTKGYDALTFDAVARRASTSKPVIYRRWTTKYELVAAAARNVLDRLPMEEPVTGNLRDDVIAFLREASERRAPVAALAIAQLAGMYRTTGTTIQDLAARLGSRDGGVFERILDHAVARGEIDPTRLTPRVRSIVNDLYQHHLVVSMKPLDEHEIVDIVDDVFLPLVRPAT